MKKNNIVLFGIAVLCACSVPKERQPLTGGQWGEIKNGSAEEAGKSTNNLNIPVSINARRV